MLCWVESEICSTKVSNKQEINTTIGQGKVTNEQIFKTHIKEKDTQTNRQRKTYLLTCQGVNSYLYL